MREIKFRAWYEFNNFDENFKMFKDWKMDVVHSLHLNKRKVMVSDRTGVTSVEMGEKCKVMQFTGLKDKNGKDIYEGDIVRVIHEDGYETVGQVEWGLSSKLFGTYPAFAITELESEMNSFAEIFDSGQYTIEIIGNIYENPELLEEKQ